MCRDDFLEKEMQPILVFLPVKTHGQKSLVGYNPWCHKELDMTKWLSIHTHTTHINHGHSISLILTGLDISVWKISDHWDERGSMLSSRAGELLKETFVLKGAIWDRCMVPIPCFVCLWCLWLEQPPCNVEVNDPKIKMTCC